MTTFRPFDVAEFLKTEADIEDYLDVVSEYDDPVLTIQALAAVARARNISQLARDTELSREGIYKALSPEGNPSFATISKIAGALGYHFALKKNLPAAET